MKILLTYPSGPHKTWEGESYVKHIKANCGEVPDFPHSFVDSGEEADAILFVEPDYYKDTSYIKLLKSEKYIIDYPNKCFTINNTDYPLCLLPGLYTSLERSKKQDPRRFRSACYMHELSRRPDEYLRGQSVEPQLLFSFRGASTALVRDRLFENQELQKFGAITRIDRVFNHTEEERETYMEEMLNSKFVLCPRGLSPSSHRLYEVMELGRVPVILSDEWIAPDGPAWLRFSIRIAESKIDELPDILKFYESKSETMAKLARQNWEEWFTPGHRAMSAFTYIEDMILQRDHAHDERLFQQDWESRAFRRQNGWMLDQRIGRKLKRVLRIEK